MYDTVALHVWSLACTDCAPLWGSSCVRFASLRWKSSLVGLVIGSSTLCSCKGNRKHPQTKYSKKIQQNQRVQGQIGGSLPAQRMMLVLAVSPRLFRWWMLVVLRCCNATAVIIAALLFFILLHFFSHNQDQRRCAVSNTHTHCKY